MKAVFYCNLVYRALAPFFHLLFTPFSFYFQINIMPNSCCERSLRSRKHSCVRHSQCVDSSGDWNPGVCDECQTLFKAADNEPFRGNNKDNLKELARKIAQKCKSMTYPRRTIFLNEIEKDFLPTRETLTAIPSSSPALRDEHPSTTFQTPGGSSVHLPLPTPRTFVHPPSLPPSEIADSDEDSSYCSSNYRRHTSEVATEGLSAYLLEAELETLDLEYTEQDELPTFRHWPRVSR